MKLSLISWLERHEIGFTHLCPTWDELKGTESEVLAEVHASHNFWERKNVPMPNKEEVNVVKRQPA